MGSTSGTLAAAMRAVSLSAWWGYAVSNSHVRSKDFALSSSDWGGVKKHTVMSTPSSARMRAA